MASHADFKKLATDRLKLAELLMSAGEWGIAAYMLGFVLECVLKAGACKALNLAVYPGPQTKEKRIISYFQTHDFDMLLAISGASDIFGISGKGAGSWSGFTQEYQGAFTNIRYDTSHNYDEVKVRKIYNFLTKSPDGIISLMDSEKKW